MGGNCWFVNFPLGGMNLRPDLVFYMSITLWFIDCEYVVGCVTDTCVWHPSNTLSSGMPFPWLVEQIFPDKSRALHLSCCVPYVSFPFSPFTKILLLCGQEFQDCVSTRPLC